MPAPDGLFLVLEGGEGVGKTTQWHRLTELLRSVGHEVVAVREPGGTPAGDTIRQLLLDPASALARAEWIVTGRPEARARVRSSATLWALPEARKTRITNDVLTRPWRVSEPQPW
mgnify:CR=1 FL=1